MTSLDCGPVLHVLVVGFHHKKGCQVEYSYPPLMSSNGDPHSNDLPHQWRHLPSLALPDGSHNFLEDTAYFHLPALDNPRKTVFGISCYRQIEADRIVNRTADITRGTVQKSVCVLSRLPLYGQIQVKMSLITEAYFREGDFTRIDLIHQTYDNLNACLTDDMLHSQQLYVGLSARQFVQKFRQKSLILFKLMLLERKVLFFQSPVKDLCSFLLTLLSLHPGMLEKGLDEAARMVPVDTPPSMSPTLEAQPDLCNDESDDGRASVLSNSSSIAELASEKVTGLRDKISGYWAGPSEEEGQVEQAQEVVPTPEFKMSSTLSTSDLGLPLNIFTGGNLCHPYLSLSYLDQLTQPSIHGYLIGATNILFKQKKGIAEVVIDIAEDKYHVQDPELKKALTLTTEDLRFVDNVVRRVSEESSDLFLDGVGWEGGDEWVRAQFRFYLICLLRSSLMNPEDVGFFNSSFMSLWTQTKNYKHWRQMYPKTKILDLVPGHPFASGHMSLTDMKLHLSNTMTNSEGGKKVSQAMANTSKAVVGGLSTAKGAFSSFITSFRGQGQGQQEMSNQKGQSQGQEEMARGHTEEISQEKGQGQGQQEMAKGHTKEISQEKGHSHGQEVMGKCHTEEISQEKGQGQMISQGQNDDISHEGQSQGQIEEISEGQNEVRSPEDKGQEKSEEENEGQGQNKGQTEEEAEEAKESI